MSRSKKKPDRCVTWGSCVCSHLWRHWQIAIEDNLVDSTEIASAQIMLNAMLSCVAYRCPDAKFRHAAALQLMHPIWSADLHCECDHLSEGH
jgi:hypothetical protein